MARWLENAPLALAPPILGIMCIKYAEFIFETPFGPSNPVYVPTLLCLRFRYASYVLLLTCQYSFVISVIFWSLWIYIYNINLKLLSVSSERLKLSTSYFEQIIPHQSCMWKYNLVSCTSGVPMLRVNWIMTKTKYNIKSPHTHTKKTGQ